MFRVRSNVTYCVEMVQYDVHIHRYELETAIHYRIAVCQVLYRKPRAATHLGSQSEVVLQVPQRPLLSPMKINCSLERIESHSANGYHSPYSTYRTLSGIRYEQFLLK